MLRCCELIKRLRNHPAATWFLEPVDPVRHMCENYFDIIKARFAYFTLWWWGRDVGGGGGDGIKARFCGVGMGSGWDGMMCIQTQWAVGRWEVD